MALRMTTGRWVAAAAVVVVAALALNAYTARSSFCGSCHSVMGKYVASNRLSSHPADVAACLDCHAAPGWVGYYHSKLEGVGNALQYYFGVQKRETAPPPGPASCLREGCHTAEELAAQTSMAPFAHATHLRSLECIDCHPGVGHEPVETERPRACEDCHDTPPAE
jgi:nitrate/TMAO reductase-like tetraheme cytochrome c subunit